MLKYQQLHQDSNHSFLKLDDGNFIVSLGRTQTVKLQFSSSLGYYLFLMEQCSCVFRAWSYTLMEQPSGNIHQSSQ